MYPTFDRIFPPKVKTEFHVRTHILNIEGKAGFRYQVLNWLDETSLFVNRNWLRNTKSEKFNFFTFYTEQKNLIQNNNEKSKFILYSYCTNRFGSINTGEYQKNGINRGGHVYSYIKDIDSLEVKSSFVQKFGSKDIEKKGHCDYLLYLLHQNAAFDFPKSMKIQNIDYQLGQDQSDFLALFPLIMRYESDRQTKYIRFRKDGSIREIYGRQEDVPPFVNEKDDDIPWGKYAPILDYDPLGNEFTTPARYYGYGYKFDDGRKI